MHMPRFHVVSTALLLLAATAAEAATIKALSFAINYSNGSGDKTPIKNYMVENGIDFGVFDYAKSTGYFINADFPDGVGNFKVVSYQNGSSDYKFLIYDSNKYELVNTPVDDKSGNNITAVFQDAYGDQYALISVRSNYYRDDNATRISQDLAPVKTYIEGKATKYPDAKIIVTYNAYLSGTNAATSHAYRDILDTYLTEYDSGPHMTCLGRTDEVGGFYMYSNDIPSASSVSLVPKSIGTKYNGSLLAFDVPTKYKVIFNDWDGTGLQTNIVFAGGSVTPPVPEREGYTFTGWDHDASEFASVSASFTATALYATDAASLLVFGDPEDIGTADPAYGTAASIAVGDSFAASVTATNVLESGLERWVCTGYTHYEITDVVTGARTVAQEGNAASFAYTHVLHDELVWHFTNEWLVAVSATAGGSVSVGDSWVLNGEALALVATPEEGHVFWGWLGDTEGIENTTATSIAPVVTTARSLRAVFAPTGTDITEQYVADTGDDANDGYSNNSPKLTIQAAVDTLAAMPGFGTVHVAAGNYSIPISASTKVFDDDNDKNDTYASVAITNAIAIVGSTGNPEGVVIRNTSTYNQAQVVVFYLNHPDALVANLTVERGHRNAPEAPAPFGGNVSIDAAGGTVSNCILRAANSIGNYARGTGAWLNSDAALLTHCVVTNNAAACSGYQYSEGIGVFVHVARGTVANCLIANNRDDSGTGFALSSKQAWANGVAVDNGALLNCSVVTNEARFTAGVYLHPNGVATNVVVAGCVNRCTYTNSLGQIAWSDIGFKGTLANASHCASDGGEELDETCVAGTAQQFFRDYTAHDYSPAAAAQPNVPTLVNKGVAYEGIAAFDLLGKARVQGSRPDIGCYENSARCTLILVK